MPVITPTEKSFTVGEETFEAILERVRDSLHESLQCDIRIIRNEANGNYQLSFDNSLFVGVNRNLPREENDRRRSQAVGKRFALLGALTNEFAKLGLEFGKHLAPRDTRQSTDADGNRRWTATTQLWINIPNAQSAGTAAPAATDEDLMANALAINSDKADAILEKESSINADGKLTTLARARLRALIASSMTKDVPAPTPTPTTETAESNNMPTD